MSATITLSYDFKIKFSLAFQWLSAITIFGLVRIPILGRGVCSSMSACIYCTIYSMILSVVPSCRDVVVSRDDCSRALLPSVEPSYASLSG